MKCDFEVLAIERCDRLTAGIVIGHFNETETAGAARGAIGHEVRFHDGAKRGEGVLQVVLRRVEGEISNKQFIVHVMFYCPTNRCLSQTVPDHRVSNHHRTTFT